MVDDNKPVEGATPAPEIAIQPLVDEPEVSSVEPVAPEDLTQIHEHNRNLAVLALYLVGALIVALIVVFGARAIYHKVHHKNNGPAPAPADTNKLPPSPGTTQTPSSGSNNSSTGSGTPSASKPSSSQSSTPSQTSLPNNGPGDVVGIFVTTSIAAAGLHFIVSLRRDAHTI